MGHNKCSKHLDVYFRVQSSCCVWVREGEGGRKGEKENTGGEKDNEYIFLDLRIRIKNSELKIT